MSTGNEIKVTVIRNDTVVKIAGALNFTSRKLQDNDVLILEKNGVKKSCKVTSVSESNVTIGDFTIEHDDTARLEQRLDCLFEDIQDEHVITGYNNANNGINYSQPNEITYNTTDNSNIEFATTTGQNNNHNNAFFINIDQNNQQLSTSNNSNNSNNITEIVNSNNVSSGMNQDNVKLQISGPALQITPFSINKGTDLRQVIMEKEGVGLPMDIIVNDCYTIHTDAKGTPISVENNQGNLKQLPNNTDLTIASAIGILNKSLQNNINATQNNQNNNNPLNSNNNDDFNFDVTEIVNSNNVSSGMNQNIMCNLKISGPNRQKAQFPISKGTNLRQLIARNESLGFPMDIIVNDDYKIAVPNINANLITVFNEKKIKNLKLALDDNLTIGQMIDYVNNVVLQNNNNATQNNQNNNNNINLQNNVNLKISGTKGTDQMECSRTMSMYHLINYREHLGFPLQINVNDVYTINIKSPGGEQIALWKYGKGGDPINLQNGLNLTIGDAMNIMDGQQIPDINNQAQQNNQNINNFNNSYLNNFFDLNVYANPNHVNNRIDQHVQELANGAINFWNNNCNIPDSEYSCQYQTNDHGTLKYKLKIERPAPGSQQETNSISISGESESKDAKSILYTNMITRVLKKKLEEKIGHVVNTGDKVSLTAAEADGDSWFMDLERAVIQSTPQKTLPFQIKQEDKIYRIAFIDDIINKVNDPELKAHITCIKNMGYKWFVVWQSQGTDFVRFDGVLDGGGFMDFFDVIDYDLSRILQPVVRVPAQYQQQVVNYDVPRIVTTPVEYRQTVNSIINPKTVTYTQPVKNANPVIGTGNPPVIVPSSPPVIGTGNPPVIKKISATFINKTEEDIGPDMVELKKGRTKEKMTRIKVGQEQSKEKPVAVGTRVMKKNYKMPQQRLGGVKPPRRIPDVPLEKEEQEKIDITVGEPKKIKEKKKVVKRRQKQKASGKHIHDLYNIRTVENGQSAAPIEKQTVAPVAASAPQPAVQAPTPALVPAEKQRPINIFMAPEKKAEQAHKIQDNISVGLKPQDIQDNINVNLKPQDIQDKININFNHERLLDDIKALLTKQGKNDVGQIIDIVDHIKFDQKVPDPYIQLVENLQVKLHELGEKTPDNIVIDNDVVLKEIETLREQIGNIKIPEFKGDNINVNLNHLAEVNEKLKLIEDKLENLKKPTENNINDNISVTFDGYDDFTKLINDLRVDVQNLKEKNSDIIVESPGVQDITDKLTVLLEEKLKNIKINDNINVEQPNIVIDQPDLTGILDEMKKMMVNVEDNIKVQIEQKLKEQQIKIDIPDNNVNITDNTTVQNEPPAPIVIDGLQELKNEIKNEIRNEINIAERNEPDIVIDPPEEKQINVNDNIEVNQKAQVPETTKEYINQVLQNVILQGQQSKNNDMLNVIQELKAEIQALKNQDFVIDLPEEQKINVNDNIEVNQRAPEKEQKEEIIENIYEEVDKSAKKEDNKTVITNEYEEKSDPKKKETTIINEYEARHEPVIGMPPMPMRGFMAQPMMPMMMPPVFMPPPMPMPVPAQQPQQPIVITQNQSDEEEEHDFWSTFWKVFLVLLLLASIIGLGFLLWKNAQKTTEQKPETKPEPKPQPEPEPVKQEDVHITPKESVTPGPIETNEGKTVLPVCEDGTTLQLNVDADKVNLGGDVGQITQTTKDAINLENAGVHNKLISSSGKVIDTRRIEINGNEIAARDWNGKLSEATIYRGTIQNGKAVINGETYTIANANGKAYSDGAVDLASQTSYGRNGNGTLSTDFGTLKQDLQINKNNTFTLNTTTEKGTVIASNTIDDVSNNATMQNMLKDKLNDSSLTKGEYNRIMDALDDGKLNDSYLQKVNNSVTGYSLDNSNNLGNSAGY